MMKSKSKALLWATGFMITGSIAVLGTLLFINHLSRLDDGDKLAAASQVTFERKPPPPLKPEPPPKPKPRKAKAPPNPLLDLGSVLSGIDFGLPGFSTDDLAGLADDLLGAGEGLVMSDDTVDRPPAAILQAPMQYPARAKAQGMTGYVVLSLLIGVTGEIEQVKVVESYPAGVFDDVVLAGINRWRFDPAEYQGRAVRAWVKQKIRFDLS